MKHVIEPTKGSFRARSSAGLASEIRAADGCLEIEIAPTLIRLKKRGKDVVAVPDAKLPVLTADQVRDTLERVTR
ncbi:MAG: hypothetical protein ACYC9Z_17565 [Casimicrobiaceae bacterium]